eukprot:11636843-Ditylum_brightwellii.AAC.1
MLGICGGKPINSGVLTQCCILPWDHGSIRRESLYHDLITPQPIWSLLSVQHNGGWREMVHSRPVRQWHLSQHDHFVWNKLATNFCNGSVWVSQ